MRAAKKTGREEMAVMATARPALGADEVLVGVRACAICASDLPGWQSADLGEPSPGDWNENNFGFTGHEVAGDIIAVGSDSLRERLGERVWIDAITGCGECDQCEEGLQTRCANVSVVCQGFAEYVAAPARQCYGIPSGLDYASASLICDMVGTPVGAVKRADIAPGESVGVWGLGPVGVGLVQAARIAGGDPIVGLDSVQARRRLAEELGATGTLDPQSSSVLEHLRRMTDGRGLDVVLCSVRSPAAAEQAFEALRLDGRMITVAGQPPAGGNVAKWVSGSWGCDEKYWPEVLAHLVSGRFDVRKYVTHTFSLDEIDHAFGIRLHDLEGSFKVVIDPSGAMPATRSE
jgi:(R,R)-butanediol dehydrogenase/meso-butanediol dehydrogenase/diacetyl reductase